MISDILWLSLRCFNRQTVRKSMEKGYIVVHKGKEEGMVVRDTIRVAKILGVSVDSLDRWFKIETMIERDEFIVVKGWEWIKSNRGNFKKKK